MEGKEWEDRSVRDFLDGRGLRVVFFDDGPRYGDDYAALVDRIRSRFPAALPEVHAALLRQPEFRFKTQAIRLYRAYQRWARRTRAARVLPAPLFAEEMARAAPDYRLKKSRIRNRTWWLGVGLVDPEWDGERELRVSKRSL